MEIKKISERFNDAAAKYDEQRRLFIPCFDDYYKTSTEFLSSIRNDFKSVLDLGAGTGLLTKYLYEQLPGARFTLVDISDRMLEIARKRFQRLDQFTFRVADYSSELPQGNFDLIVSALSIHHLENEAKLKLYGTIYDRLEKNGFLLNLDQFNASSDFMNDCYNRFWYERIKRSGITEKESGEWIKRRELDRENTIEESIELLIKAGFKEVECIYHYMKFGVLIAVK